MKLWIFEVWDIKSEKSRESRHFTWPGFGHVTLAYEPNLCPIPVSHPKRVTPSSHLKRRSNREAPHVAPVSRSRTHHLPHPLACDACFFSSLRIQATQLNIEGVNPPCFDWKIHTFYTFFTFFTRINFFTTPEVSGTYQTPEKHPEVAKDPDTFIFLV